MKSISSKLFKTEKAKNGSSTCLYNNKYIHSAYNPEREAENLLKGFNSEKKIFILVFPGLNYLGSVLSASNKKVLSIHISDFFLEYNKDGGKSCLVSDNIYSFLKKNISLYDTSKLEIIFYQPICTVFHNETDYVSEILKNFLKETAGTRLTIYRFGRKWLKNIFMNIRNKNSNLKIIINRPVLLIGSGPSLKNIGEYRDFIENNFTVFCFSSSYEILKKQKINPDYVFHTDPGHYADYYLGSIIKDKKTIISPFTVRPGTFMNADVYPINTALNAEKLLFEQQNESNAIYDNGSVATTAVMFLKRLGVRRINVCGIDLAYEDIKSHSLGHVHYDLLSAKCVRTNTFLTVLYNKKKLITPQDINGYSTGPSLDIYANWFEHINKDETIITAVKELAPRRKVFPEITFSKAAETVQQEITADYPAVYNKDIYIEKYLEDVQKGLADMERTELNSDFIENTICGEFVSHCFPDEFSDYAAQPDSIKYRKLKQLAERRFKTIINKIS